MKHWAEFHSHRAWARGRRLLGVAALLHALVFNAGSLWAQSESLRPEVGKPLQSAQELIKAQRYKDALQKVRDADAVGGKSAYENYMVERMRLAAASGMGDLETASRSFEAANSTGKVAALDRQRMLESLTISAYRAKDYSRAMGFGQRYIADGGAHPAVRSVLIQSQYLSGDFAGTVRELNQEIATTERAGGVPPEDRLNLLLNAAQRQGNSGAVVLALEKLVTYHPKKVYWSDLVARTQRKAGYSDRMALDAYRLLLVTGCMNAANDYMEMTQLALQAGLSAEAASVVAAGFTQGHLGVGSDAGRHRRLRELVIKRVAEAKESFETQLSAANLAKEGDALITLGFNQALAGQHAQGLALMRQGLAKGKLHRAEDAKLHLGLAYRLAGDTAQAQATLKTVSGNDGPADLARLWLLLVKQKV